MRISQLSIAIACVCAQGAFAQSITEVQAEAVESRALTTSLDTSYLRSAAGQNSAYYQEYWAAGLQVNYALPQDASLRLSTGVSRNLDALEERYVMGSTSLEYYSQGFDLPADNKFQYSVQGILPTNKDNRDYLSYRGSLGLGLSLSHSWKFHTLVDSVAFGVDGGATRHLYKYDSSQTGIPNTIIDLTAAASARVVIQKIFNITGSYGLDKIKKSNGTWKDPDYIYSLAFAAEVGKNFVLSVAEAMESRAISYDAQTAEFALYDYRKTVYKAAASYTF